jgi:hypothetical protein
MYRPLVVPLVAFFLVSVPRFLGAQDSCHKQFVVSEVVLPTTTQLPASEQAAVRVRLIGRCFDNQQLGQLASEVRGVLESLGYLQAAVPEPSITVSDASRHPQPVSLDFEVKEGARYKVREIQLNGYRTLSSEQIMALSETQIEEFFDGNKMRQTAQFPQANRLTVHILAAVAEHEAAMISARTKAALAAAKKRGVWLGGDRGGIIASQWPKGVKASAKVRRAKAHKRANDLLPLIDSIRSKGASSLSEIAEALNQRNIPAPRGGAWYPMQVQRVLRAADAL